MPADQAPDPTTVRQARNRRHSFAAARQGLIIVLSLWALFVPTAKGGAEEAPMPIIELPPPRLEGDLALEAALARRRSVRDFAAQPLTRMQLGQILWAAQGITGRRWPMRTAPSAGGLYPLEVFVVAGQVDGLEPGLYRYRPGGHALSRVKEGDHRRALARAALGQGWIGQAPVTVVIAGVVARTAAKYGRRAERYMFMEAGHAAQNVYLQAQGEGLGTTAVGAFKDSAVQALLGMSADEAPLYLLPVGVPR
jgi:SagB-type dehydrogenase family enzyme